MPNSGNIDLRQLVRSENPWRSESRSAWVPNCVTTAASLSERPWTRTDCVPCSGGATLQRADGPTGTGADEDDQEDAATDNLRGHNYRRTGPDEAPRLTSERSEPCWALMFRS
jgi:hypothetical protein